MYPLEMPRAVGAKIVSVDPLVQAAAGIGASPAESDSRMTWMLMGSIGLLGVTMWVMSRGPQ